MSTFDAPLVKLVAALALVAASACSAAAPPHAALVATAPLSPLASAAPPASKPAFENRGGLWLPSQMPERAQELRQLGLVIDPALLADPSSSLLASIVNLNGCSASFVSKQGLVVTNHHCAIAALQRNSTPAENLLETGLLAKTRAEERSSGPAARLSVLSKMIEVTAQVRPSLLQIQDHLARRLELDRFQKELVAGCERGRPGVRCGLHSLYEGQRYFLMETLEIRDVRLVYAPAEGIGNFGGEIDNWRWPRHCGDVTFFRAYVGKDGLPADYSENNVPYQPPATLKLAAAPLAEGELVMVAGYPGHTSLLAPRVEAQQVVEKIYPERLAMFDAYLALIDALSKNDPEVAIKATGRKRGFDNYRTKHLGELEGLKRSNVLERRLADEQSLQRFIAADAARQASFGSVLSELEGAFAEREKTRQADVALEREILMPRLLWAAYLIARMADERQKPDAARDPAYQARNFTQLRDQLKQLSASYHPKLDRAILKLALQRDRGRAAELRSPALELIAGKAPTDQAIDAALAKLYDKTKLGDEQLRLDLFEKAQPAALAAHADPIVRLGTKLLPLLRAAEERHKRHDGHLLLLKPRYLEALLAFRGGAVAPDANGTLRIAYGTIKRAPAGEPGSNIGAFTTLSQLVKKHTGQAPFDAPDKLLRAARSAARSRYLDKSLGDVPVDFLSDLHITNGNSGSATINARGELVGLVFDGTYESVASDWMFLPGTRSIHVDLRYVLFLLRDVEGAHTLLKELGD